MQELERVGVIAGGRIERSNEGPGAGGLDPSWPGRSLDALARIVFAFRGRRVCVPLPAVGFRFFVFAFHPIAANPHGHWLYEQVAALTSLPSLYREALRTIQAQWL